MECVRVRVRVWVEGQWWKGKGKSELGKGWKGRRVNVRVGVEG